MAQDLGFIGIVFFDQRRLLNHIPPEKPFFSPRNVVFAVLYALIAFSLFGFLYGMYRFCKLMTTPLNRI
jgi:hypothetical protein